jgi:hypothetical protein
MALFFGIESGSQRVLDAMRKGTRREAVPVAIRRAKEAGIFAVGSIIYPSPGDTDETAAETVALLEEARPDALTVQAPIIVPRTDWFERPERYGIALHDRERYLREALACKMNLLLPPAFWPQLPVSVDGQGYRRVLSRTGAFVKRLRDKGYLTSASDDTYLMSVAAGMPVETFRDATARACFAGDAPLMRGLIEKVNDGL